MLTAAVGILSDMCGSDWMSLVLTQLREFRYRLEIGAQLTSSSLATWGHDSQERQAAFNEVDVSVTRHRRQQGQRG
jgi:hypothetical protein